jgi:hypothetical protein
MGDHIDSNKEKVRQVNKLRMQQQFLFWYMMFVSQTGEEKWAMATYNSTFTNTINKTAETVVIAEILKLIQQNLYWMAL